IDGESKLSSHFMPLETRLPDGNAALFTILLFAIEGSNSLRAWESLEEQTMKNWDLIIVNPPSGNSAIFDLVSRKKLIERVILCADFSSVAKILEARTSHYISFIGQNASWMSDKLSHEYAIFSSSPAVMLFSAPLLIPSRLGDNARIPRYRVKPN